jgi:DNA gyrase/topoisomerase IV subunit A
VERSVLEAMGRLGFRIDRPHRKCATIVEHVAQEFGVSRRYGYEALCAMSQPWRLHLPLVDFHGNNGSADENDRPAPPRMTEARMSRAGMAALAAELGTGPLVPWTLINGDLHVDGYAPPFSPTRVIDTLLALIDAPDLSDQDIIEGVGPPTSPTGCGTVCDYYALGAGASTTMVQTARIAYEERDGEEVVVLTDLPLGIGEFRVVEALSARVEAMSEQDPDWQPYEFNDESRAWSVSEAPTIPLADVRIESHSQVARIVCYPLPHATPVEYEPLIASTWGVRTEHSTQLPAPLPVLLRELIDDDHEAQRAALS